MGILSDLMMASTFFIRMTLGIIAFKLLLIVY